MTIVIIVVLVGGGVYFATRQTSKPTQVTTTQSPTPKATAGLEATTTAPKAENFENIKTPHFVSSEPANNQVLSKGPSQVTINFNFNLTTGSKISVAANDNEVTTQQGTKIAADKLSMTALINPVEPAVYKVNYTACWPDGSCHDGSFGFTVAK